MLHPSDDLSQSQNFTIHVHQVKNGRYQATSPNAPEAGFEEATSPSMAASKLDSRLQSLHRDRKLRSA